MRYLLLSFCVGAIALVGCTPRVRIRQSPGPRDTGIRYYRPKPYLLIEPAEIVTTVGETATTSPSQEFVSITLDYLPDFTEEYSINVSSGLGTADVSVTLEDGWNLTQLNQVIDSNFDENVAALAELASAGASAFVPTSASDAPAGSKRKYVVQATNVPIGYYESVLGRDSCGKKRLYGWRYVGFMPHAQCPTDMCGANSIACGDVGNELFGLVFDQGVMTFRPLGSTGDGNPRRVSVSTGEYTVAKSEGALLHDLEGAIERVILAEEGMNSDVTITKIEDGIAIEITVFGSADAGAQEALIKSIAGDEDIETYIEEVGNPRLKFTIGFSAADGAAPDDGLSYFGSLQDVSVAPMSR